MLDILDQIDQASGAGFYYVALMSALAVPDIAAALDAPNGRTGGQLYAAWFDKYVGPKYVMSPGRMAPFQALLGDDAYYFRCSMLHQGAAQLQTPKAGYNRIFFFEPGATSSYGHMNIIGNALHLDAR